jgi:hypothetical protein
MFATDNEQLSRDFIDCFNAAGMLLDSVGRAYSAKAAVKDATLPPFRWIKAIPYGPHLEHLSFFFGNQAFFVQLVDVDGNADFPGSLEGLATVVQAYQGIACFLPMKKKKSVLRSEWQPIYPEWGLIEASTGKPLNPMEHMPTEPVRMTDWELHDSAIQIVRDHLQNSGKKVISWNSSPIVQPALWFQDGDKPAWCIVRMYTYPDPQPGLPENIADIQRQLEPMGCRGYHAEVGFIPLGQQEGDPCLPFYRGDACSVNFQGIQPLPELKENK